MSFGQIIIIKSRSLEVKWAFNGCFIYENKDKVYENTKYMKIPLPLVTVFWNFKFVSLFVFKLLRKKLNKVCQAKKKTK